MRADEAHPGQKIRWTKESRTFEGIVEDWQHPLGAVVRVDGGGLTHVIAADREVEVIG